MINQKKRKENSTTSGTFGRLVFPPGNQETKVSIKVKLGKNSVKSHGHSSYSRKTFPGFRTWMNKSEPIEGIGKKNKRERHKTTPGMGWCDRWWEREPDPKMIPRKKTSIILFPVAQNGKRKERRRGRIKTNKKTTSTTTTRTTSTTTRGDRCNGKRGRSGRCPSRDRRRTRRVKRRPSASQCVISFSFFFSFYPKPSPCSKTRQKRVNTAEPSRPEAEKRSWTFVNTPVINQTTTTKNSTQKHKKGRNARKRSKNGGNDGEYAGSIFNQSGWFFIDFNRYS